MRRPCKVDGCDRLSDAKGMCLAHYNRWRRTGDVKADLPIHRPTASPCRVDGCGRPSEAHGLCGSHDQRTRSVGGLRPHIPLGQINAPPRANPWAGQRSCPECDSDRWTMPQDRADWWVCVGCGHHWRLGAMATA